MNDSTLNEPNPVSLRSQGDTLLIEWSDGVTHKYTWAQLREHCPCATCRIKRSQPPTALPVLSAAEAAPLLATAMEPLGHYAYRIEFSDGHQTGIYSLELLRQLGAHVNE